MPPKVSDKSSKKASKTSKKKTHKRKDSYDTYIRKILQEVRPDREISSKALVTMNRFVEDVFRRIATEALELSHYSKQKTITCRNIESAVRLLFPGNLAEKAVAVGNKAVGNYELYLSQD